MKRKPFVLCAVLIIACACHTEKVSSLELTTMVEMDPVTKVKTSYTAYKANGGHQMIRHGTFVSWYPSGAKYIEMSFDHGLEDGKCTIYSEEGEAHIVGWFKKGKPWEGHILIGEFVGQYHKGRWVGVRKDSTR